MKTKKLPKSIRKFIRLEKARIRRENLTLKDQNEKLRELSKKYFKQNENRNKGNTKN